MITLEQLVAVFDKTPRARLVEIHPHLVAAMAEFGIDTKDEVCMFLARAGEETSGLAVFSENLNYSSQGLLDHFSHYFDQDQATAYARQPVRIANRIYANRMGNGPEDSGDGWKYRGAGIFQTTGKTNQTAAAQHLGVSVDAAGDYLRSPVGACRSAGYFWKSNNLDAWVAKDDFDGVNDITNRGHKTAAEGDAIGFHGAEGYLHKLQSVMAGA